MTDFFYEVTESTAHLYRQMHVLLRRKQICFHAIFEVVPTARQQGKVTALNKKVFFGITFQKRKSVKSVRERSILAVRITKYEPVRGGQSECSFSLWASSAMYKLQY